MNSLEILAPAGNMESAYSAINSGANAIYLGLTSFSARSSAENFNTEELQQIVTYAHALDVKVYVAMNTLIKQKELQSFCNTAVDVWNLGIDAIIIQDLFVGKYLKECYPQMILHLSTQAGTNNALGAQLAKEFGFSRVILARETHLAEIREIAAIIETEVFVQGALCTCFSGQCYFSSFVGGNSGNRGKCKQPCRKLYSYNREGYSDQAYRLSLADLNVSERIEDLVDAGVTSFKIEGRMRRPEYVAAAVQHYVNLLSKKDSVGSLKVLKRTYNRGNYTHGLAFGQDKSFISSAVQGHIGEYIGVVKVEHGKYLCRVNEQFQKGDAFKVLRSGKEVGGAIYAEQKGQNLILTSKQHLKNGDKVFVTTDTACNTNVLKVTKKKKLSIQIHFAVGEVGKVTINGKSYVGQDIITEAKNQPLTKEIVCRCFEKVDKYPFHVEIEKIDFVGNVFMPTSQLNALRRMAYENYYQEICNQSREVIAEYQHKIPTLSNKKGQKTAVIATTCKDLHCDIAILKYDNYANISTNFGNFVGEKFIYVPAYCTKQDLTMIEKAIPQFDGIYGEGYFSILLAKKHGKKLFAGTGFNLSNTMDCLFCGADYYAISKELTMQESEELIAENSFYFSAGNIKVMDFIYCPFEKSCKMCDKKQKYVLTDENGRQFILRRYVADSCRFELFNCADLVFEQKKTNGLYDFTLVKDVKYATEHCQELHCLKEIFPKYTSGHTTQSIY